MKIPISARFLCVVAFLAALAPITGRTDTINLYVTANQGGGRVFEYDSAGTRSTFVDPSPNLPRGLAFDSNGNLFVAATNANNHGTILKFSPASVQTFFGSAPGFLEGLTIDSAGNIFVVSFDNSSPTLASTIFEFTPGGTRSIFGSLPSQSFGLAFNNAGNLFAADFSDQTVFEFTPGGTRTVFAGPAAFGVNSGPTDLSFDSAGNLFVSTLHVTTLSGDVLQFTPGGVESTFATGLNSPRGLAFDSSGNLFVAENLNRPAGDIVEFTPGGIETVFASDIGRPQFLTFGPARGPAIVPDTGSTLAFLFVALAGLICVHRRTGLVRQ